MKFNGNCYKGQIYTVLLITVFLFNAFSQACCAKNNSDEEEKQFTEVKSIDSKEVKPLNNKTYDDAVTIKEIYIDGNHLVKTETILNKLNIKTGTKFDRDSIQEDLKNIYKMGYFTEKLKAVPEQTNSGITLRIQVEENIPVTGFTVTGNNVVSSEEIIKLLNRQEGLPQNITELNNSIKEIENLYADKGYILARVQRVSDDPDGVINIQLNEGKIQEIKVSGNTKTKDFVIKRNLTIAPGEVYNENKLKQDLARLFGTQAFSDVRRVISASPDDPDKYKITIEVDEKRTGSISLGGGVDTESGFFGSVGYADNNFRGLGQELSTNFTVGSGVVFNDDDVVDKAPLQFEANFVEPRLKNTLNSLRVSAFGRDMASYQVPLAIEKRFGGEVEFARPIKKVPNLAGSVSVGVENISMKEGDEAGIKQKFLDEGYTNDFAITERFNQLQGGVYLVLGSGLVYDTRNSIINPTEGWYTSVAFKQSIGLTEDLCTKVYKNGTTENFTRYAGSFGKVSGSVKKYYPVGEKSTVLIGGKISTKVVGDLPEFAAFRLGGPYSIRGFREGDIGNGQGFMMATAEFRTPVPYMNRIKYKFLRDIRVAFFADAGKLFHKTFVTDLYDRPGYGISVGSGLIVPIPMLGPVRFDYGYPITNVGKDNKKGNFTFAVGERY